MFTRVKKVVMKQEFAWRARKGKPHHHEFSQRQASFLPGTDMTVTAQLPRRGFLPARARASFPYRLSPARFSFSSAVLERPPLSFDSTLTAAGGYFTRRGSTLLQPGHGG